MKQKFLLLVWILLFPCISSAGEPLVVTVVTKGSFTDAGKRIIEEAYRRIGVPIVFENLPGERALINTNDGKTDAELFRIDNINQRNPNLIKVPVSYIPNEVSAFSKLDIEIDCWESIKDYTTACASG